MKHSVGCRDTSGARPPSRAPCIGAIHGAIRRNGYDNAADSRLHDAPTKGRAGRECVALDRSRGRASIRRVNGVLHDGPREIRRVRLRMTMSSSSTPGDAVVGVAPKLEVHRQGRLHRAVSVVLFDDHGRLLLQRRAGREVPLGRAMVEHVLWSSASGRVGRRGGSAPPPRRDGDRGVWADSGDRSFCTSPSSTAGWSSTSWIMC